MVKAVLPWAVIVAAGLMTLVLAGCSAAPAATPRKEAVDTIAPPAGRVDIPAIDARAPADTETATFALG